MHLACRDIHAQKQTHAFNNRSGYSIIYIIITVHLCTVGNILNNIHLRIDNCDPGPFRGTLF